MGFRYSGKVGMEIWLRVLSAYIGDRWRGYRWFTTVFMAI